jgi:integrase
LEVKKRTKKYISDYTNTLNILADYQKVLLCDLTAEEIESIFDKFSTSSRDAHLRKLKAVVNYAEKKKFIDSNFLKSIELIGSGGKNVEIFTNAQVKLILKYVAEKEIDYLPYIAVLFFAGVRPEGCQKLKWSDFTKDGRIHLGYTINKGNKDGLAVDVNKTLNEWLSWYFSKGRNQAGMILNKTTDELRGFRRKMEVELKSKDPNYAWIQDGPRRNFCSAYIRIHGEQEAVKATGHVDVKMLRKHYKKNIELSDAQEYWDITPISLGL